MCHMQDLYEFLHQGKLIQKLVEIGVASDEDLGTTYGKVLNGSILFSMKLKKKKEIVTDSQFDLTVNKNSSEFIENFPLISKMDNPVVIAEFIHQFKKDNPGVHIDYDMLPEGPPDLRKLPKKRTADGKENKEKKKAKPFVEEAKK